MIDKQCSSRLAQMKWMLYLAWGNIRGTPRVAAGTSEVRTTT